MQYNYNIIIYSKTGEDCSDVKAFLETAFKKVVVTSNLSAHTRPFGIEFDLIIADIRSQADNGEKDIQKAIAAANTSRSIPVIALCNQNCLPEYMTAVSCGSDIIDFPLDESATLRRCLRAIRRRLLEPE